MTIKNIRRGPDQPVYGVDGPPTSYTEADFLLVDLDVFQDGTKVVTRRLAFADHAGLEAEWEAGVATTVLNAAIQAAVDAEDATDPLASVQRAIIGASKTPA